MDDFDSFDGEGHDDDHDHGLHAPPVILPGGSLCGCPCHRPRQGKPSLAELLAGWVLLLASAALMIWLLTVAFG